MLVMLLATAAPGSAQEFEKAKPWWTWGGTKHLYGMDLQVFTPHLRVFFADSVDTGEIEPFAENQTGAGVQLFAADVVMYWGQGRLLTGGSMGFGSSILDGKNLILVSFSAFIQFYDMLRVEAGWAWAAVNDSRMGEKTRDRSATFLSLSFPTKVGAAVTGR